MREVYDVCKEYEQFLNVWAFRPDRELFPYPKKDTVIDEDRSVRWNREEVERLRQSHDEEVKRLHSEYNTRCKEYDKMMIDAIAEQYHISKKKSEYIYCFAQKRNGKNIYAATKLAEALVELVKNIENS